MLRLVTHVDSRCNISTMIAIALLRGLIRREVRTEQQINQIIQRCKRQLDYFVKNIPDAGQNKEAYYTVSSSDELSRLLTAESMDDLQLDRSEDRGDVWKCLGAGIFCLRYAMARLERVSGQEREDLRKTLFADTINNLVLRGGAAQANAAFAGALLGAYLGYDLVPEKWRKGLRDYTESEEDKEADASKEME
ncbi:putative adp-ribosylglycohydrolase-like protein [Diaporthe ampelina]|uniref:Putative adp-ribosylglycohydrolase-like protein n=1 Tax=Diaporthe ampelina TaxID=1214573 RepID=A0A0G2IGD0_9PEZI|nr:putative adp-ribosylglycohydrolase-like protein [Diaporthe ampelina]